MAGSGLGEPPRSVGRLFAVVVFRWYFPPSRPLPVSRPLFPHGNRSGDADDVLVALRRSVCFRDLVEGIANGPIQQQYELLGWAVLTGLVWTVFRRIEVLPKRLRTLTRSQMLGNLLFGISVFFLGMSVLDPVVQLGVQRLPWSSGLATEVGFFVPAAFILMNLARRLRA